VTIFTLWFENFPNNLPALFISVGVAVLFVVIILRAAMSSDGRSRWTKRITGANGKLFWGMLFFLWAVVFGVGLQLVPHTGANSPYGGIGLIALFSGFFISMGFIWSVIGE
jgi:4-amino-4-deoxy-L-arabinose transferase-like glycosyltransferase